MNDDATQTHHHHLHSFLSQAIDSFWYVPHYQSLSFETNSLNNQPPSIIETLKIPVNKFGMPLIARLINIDTNLSIPATIQMNDPFTSTEVWQRQPQDLLAQIKQENNQAFMVEALQHSYVIG